MSKDIRASRPAVTPYKKAQKPMMSAEERKRQAKSLVVRKPDGSDAS